MSGRPILMRAWTIIAVLFAAQYVAWPQSAAVPPPPVPPVRPVIDDYFGTKATDPYRYMENLESDEVQQWLKLQNDYARAILAKIPGRQAPLDRRLQAWHVSPSVTSKETQLFPIASRCGGGRHRPAGLGPERLDGRK